MFLLTQLFERKPGEEAERRSFNGSRQIFSFLPFQGCLSGCDLIVRVWRLDVVEGFCDSQRVIFKIPIGFEGEGVFDVLGLIGIPCNFESLKMGQELTFSALQSKLLIPRNLQC